MIKKDGEGGGREIFGRLREISHHTSAVLTDYMNKNSTGKSAHNFRCRRAVLSLINCVTTSC